MQIIIKITLFFLFLFLFGCETKDKKNTSLNTPSGQYSTQKISSTAALPDCIGTTVRQVSNPDWSPHFKNWLENHSYSYIAKNQGWGGIKNCSFSKDRDPVIFIHGNDSAENPSSHFSKGGYPGTNIKAYFMANGYSECDLYAITWVAGGLSVANHHKADYLILLRNFIKAVLAYTGKTRVDVIGWSMGVTMGRKAIKGGVAYNDPARSSSSACQLGSNLKDSVHTFLGIVGGNRGLVMCLNSPMYICSENGAKIDAEFLQDINGGSKGNYNPEPIATNIYSIYSYADKFICINNTCDIYGVHTSRIPGESFSVSYDVDNSKFLAWGLNNMDHITILYDNLTGGKGSLSVILKLIRDNDTNIK